MQGSKGGKCTGEEDEVGEVVAGSAAHGLLADGPWGGSAWDPPVGGHPRLQQAAAPLHYHQAAAPAGRPHTLPQPAHPSPPSGPWGLIHYAMQRHRHECTKAH